MENLDLFFLSHFNWLLSKIINHWVKVSKPASDSVCFMCFQGCPTAIQTHLDSDMSLCFKGTFYNYTEN